tara:strand:- start:1557 stop:2543 length:987 start_codon:yes stop_codon:yes gene_type:complete
MKKFNNIYKERHSNGESSLTLVDYMEALEDFKDAMSNKKNKLYDSFQMFDVVGKYYQNALQIGKDAKFFSEDLIKEIKEANSELPIVECVGVILKGLEALKENEAGATLGSVNGMGEVSLPAVEGDIGSGDVPQGATGEDEITISIQKPAKTTMKKFDKIKESREIFEGEVYFPITDIGDPASLIQVLAKELQKRTPANLSNVVAELTNIEISYNGLVDIETIEKLSTMLDNDPKSVKKKIDKLMDKHINLLENMQVEFMRQLLNDPSSINEGILGRALGGVAGFTLGPKVGKIIAKVLGIQKGPLYNILTSRVVSAALAQELTKNIF